MNLLDGDEVQQKLLKLRRKRHSDLRLQSQGVSRYKLYRVGALDGRVRHRQNGGITRTPLPVGQLLVNRVLTPEGREQISSKLVK